LDGQRLHRELDAEYRAAPRRLVLRENAAVSLDDALAEGEPEPGPLPNRLGREEGLEDPRPNLGRDTRTIVGDREDDHPALSVGTCRDGDPAWARVPAQDMVGIGDQVHEH